MTLVIYDLNSILDLLVQFIISISKQALINWYDSIQKRVRAFMNF